MLCLRQYFLNIILDKRRRDNAYLFFFLKKEMTLSLEGSVNKSNASNSPDKDRTLD